MQNSRLWINVDNNIQRFSGFFIIAFECLPFLSFGQETITRERTRNFTKVWEALSPQADANMLLAKPLPEVRLSATYYDGLARAEQLVVRQGSLATATGVTGDLVSPVVYDPQGREPDRYLPYAATTTGGLFKDSALFFQHSFYQSPGSPVFTQKEQYFFSRTVQEPSPLGRVTQTLAPGKSWVGQGRGVLLSSQVNTALDSVRLWKVTEEPEGFGAYRSDTTYPAGTLYKKVTTGEEGKKVVEYQDRQGRVIQKKVQQTGSPCEGNAGWLSTCYLYDDLERLRAVLQPAAIEALEAGPGLQTPDTELLDELSFRYRYDARGRMTAKKVPGAGVVYMVYDARDRLVMTQSADMRKPGSGQWLVTGYDTLNRPLTTGLWSSGDSHAYHLHQAYSSLSYPVTTSNFELLTQSHYDDYQNLPQGLKATLSGSYSTYLGARSGAPQYAEPVVASPLLKGMVTWVSVKVLGQDKYLSTVNIYDDKGRVIQTQSLNYGGATDIATTQYDFAGKILKTCLEHHRQPGTGPVFSLGTRNTYDDLGRISGVEKNISNTGWKATVVFEYGALGALTGKKLAPDYNQGQGLETLTYDYNIRGWLLGVNRSYLRAKNTAGYNNRFFAFELGYDQPGTEGGTSFSAPQYGGNIAGVLWKSSGDEVRRKYDFTYDPVNRFGKASFTQNTEPSSDGAYNTTGANFSVHGFDQDNNYLLRYDANGNILSMVQHGIKGFKSDLVIDALRYTYNPRSNKLRQVHDDTNDNTSTLGDFTYDPATKTAVDYGYDKNGNLVTDLNRHLNGATGTDLEGGGAITYNHLNLPVRVTVAGKGTIQYVYDASGNKLAKTVQETGLPDRTTLYMAGGALYYNDTLQSLGHEQGRIRPIREPGSNQVTGYAFDYFIRDHLGSVRMVLTDEQRRDLYPAASLELATLDSEKHYYLIPEGSVVNKATVPAYPQSDLYTSPNDYVQRLNGSGQRVGTSLVLKVMSGDRVSIRASSWYRQNGAVAGNPSRAVADIVTSLLQGIAGVPAGKLSTLTAAQQSGLASGVTSFLSQPGREQGATGARPKSYLNWLLLDEQLRPVITGDGNNSGFEAVGLDQQLTLHQVTERPLTKNGYLYIYLSNESPDVDVFFDNLQVTHTRGPLTEETHYYPFGLEMARISSKAAGRMQNNKKYNGIEFDNDLDLNTYEAFYRNLDPQIGRWWQIDPKVDAGYESISPYASMYDDPIRFSDPLGDEGDDEQCTTCPIFFDLASFEKFSGHASKVGGAIADGVKTFMNSAGGVLNGMLNTLTFGTWPTNPAETITNENTLTTDEQQLVSSSVVIGQDGAMVMSMGEGLNPFKSFELAPVNGPKVSLPKGPGLPLINKPKAPNASAPTQPPILNAHGLKKQSTGSIKKSGDSHMYQYKNFKKGNNKNPNEKKGAKKRRNANKPIN